MRDKEPRSAQPAPFRAVDIEDDRDVRGLLEYPRTTII
jgi:hypothetical protein